MKALQCPLLRSATARFRGARLTINALFSERVYFSSKHLIVRHKVVQQHEQICGPLDKVALICANKNKAPVSRGRPFTVPSIGLQTWHQALLHFLPCFLRLQVLKRRSELRLDWPYSARIFTHWSRAVPRTRTRIARRPNWRKLRADDGII